MVYCKNIIIVIVILGASFLKLIAQTNNFPNRQVGFKFEQLGIEQGLSQSTVYAITQDKQGFIWLGTQDGLNRYDGYNFKIFKEKGNNSISYSVVWSLITDSDGNIWIGTERGGVDLFIPQKGIFINYNYNPKDTNSISDNFITVIYQDSKNNVWLGTNSGGLNLYNKSTKKFQRFYSNKKINSLVGNTIRAICEDGFGNLWIGTSNGLSKLNLNDFYRDMANPEFISYQYSAENQNSISSNNVWAMYADSKKRLWIGTWGGGLNLYNHNKDSFQRFIYDPGDHLSIPSNNIKAIIEVADGSLWLGSYDAGLISFDVESNKFYKLNIKDFILTLYRDIAGSIWIGTYSTGIKTFSSRQNIFKNYYQNYFDNDIIQNRNVSAIFETDDGELLIGTYGNGLEHFNKQRNRFTKYQAEVNNPYSLSNNRITSIIQSQDGNIWIATSGGGLNLFNKKSKKFFRYMAKSKTSSNSVLFNQISTLCYDKKENKLYLGYFNGGLSSFDLTERKFDHFVKKNFNGVDNWKSPVTAIYIGEKTGLWFANFEGDLFNYNKEKNIFFKIDLPVFRSSADKKAIYFLKEIEDSIMWMGTYGDGLYKFDLRINKLDIFNEENSEVSNHIYGFLDDDSGNLWCSSNSGIFRFNIYNKSVKAFDMTDGLQSNEFNQGAFFKNSKGELFFGGVNGFNSFFPTEVIKNEFVPPIFITGFKVFNKPLELPNPIPDNIEIVLSYYQNLFSFEFVGLNFIMPGKNQYLYKLEGFDKEWNKVNAQQRYGIYTNLDPGEYDLRVKGSNNDGKWNEQGSTIKIIITPPFWMTWWFRSIGIIFIISLVFIVYKSRVKTLEKEKLYQQNLSSHLIEKQEEERTRIAQEMHDTLGQDLLFIKNRILLTMQKFPDNKINNHLELILDSSSVLLKKVREISHNLRPPELDRLGLTETLKSLLQKLKDSTSLDVIGEIDEIDGLIQRKHEINLIRIVQESLNNIMKHSEATECVITVMKTNSEIFISIYDNGKGFKLNNLKEVLNKSMGIGITGIYERVRILKGTIQINSDHGKGTDIKINIPVSNKELLAN
ncbi:MAG TPA: two-component regulator propeller domain-containing protein [Ignavibacteriaceae bacterium]|nr:two-component regulator propeller domain-containing protein [Ignavibacteriaceae bacterium]